MADEPPTDMLLQLPTSELAGMNLVSSLPTLIFKSPTLSFEIGMEPFPDLMFGSSDGGLSFVNGFSPELMIEGAIDKSCPQNLLLANTMNSFLDLMFESPKLKSLFVGADLISQSPEQERNYGSYRCLKVEFPRPALPVANGTGTAGSSSASSVALHRKHLNIAKLRVGIHDIREAETRSTADLLIEEAVERKLKEVDLDLQYQKLPRKVFTVSTIRVLKLKRCRFELSGGIDLPELRELHLEWTACDQQSVQTFLSCCRLIEILSLTDLTCLTSLHVRGLPKLHMLKIYSCSKRFNMGCVEIDAPALQHLDYSSTIRSQVVLRNCEFLKELHLHGAGIEEETLQYFLSNLPNLEQLTIWGTTLQHLEISHSNLKQLKLSLCWDQKETCAKFDTPNLLSFRYSGYRMPLFHAMTSINASSLQEVAISMDYEDYEHHRNTFSFQEYHDYYNGFISKLKEFFDKLKHCRVIELTIRSEDEFFFPRDFLRDQISVYSPPFCDIKHLTLMVHADREEFEYIIDQVLWMCHPQTLFIKYYWCEEFLKALHYKFMGKDDHLKMCCANSPIKCWRHYLEDFQVKDDEIDRVFTLSKGGVFEPKILEKEVRFELKWRSQPL